MDIDNMKQMWQQYDAELKRSNMINEKLMQKILKDRSSVKARNLSAYEYLSLAICGILIVIFVAMWPRMAQTPDLQWFYFIDLLLCAVGLNWNIYKLGLINKVDSNDSVVDMAAQVNQLRMLTIREKMWSIVLMPLLICCMVPVLHNWIHGGSAFDYLNAYIPRIVAGYVIAVVLTVWLYKRFLLKDIQAISDNLREIDALKRG
ncbi:MAG TPA: hypothetical protein VEB40_04545 [Flavipsychrobacter sp.]|nr:hypothetical protein [Flavipsychrobacter sp.]